MNFTKYFCCASRALRTSPWWKRGITSGTSRLGTAAERRQICRPGNCKMCWPIMDSWASLLAAWCQPLDFSWNRSQFHAMLRRVPTGASAFPDAATLMTRTTVNGAQRTMVACGRTASACARTRGFTPKLPIIAGHGQPRGAPEGRRGAAPLRSPRGAGAAGDRMNSVNDSLGSGGGGWPSNPPG